MTSLNDRYPNIAAWVQDGWIEIGHGGDGGSFLRVLDEGGQIWESDETYASLDEALAAMDRAIAKWHEDNTSHRDPGGDTEPQGAAHYSFTPKQGQYLAFIHSYTELHGIPPAQADIQRFFGTTPPTVHSMILRLEEAGLLTRQPQTPRSLRVVVPPQLLPRLQRPS